MLDSTVRDRWFYAAFSSALVALIAAGFAPSFYARGWFATAGSLPALVQWHGIVATAWVLVFALQTTLVAQSRLQWHRRVGVAGAALAAVFVALGTLVIVRFEQTHGAEARNVLAAHAFTNGAPLAAFGVLVAAGFWQRRVAARHKRLMLLAAVVLMPPAIGRLFGALDLARFNFPLYACFALLHAAYDVFRRGRPHPISLVGGAALVALDVAATAWLAAVES